jgi:hypothetical protein
MFQEISRGRVALRYSILLIAHKMRIVLVREMDVFKGLTGLEKPLRGSKCNFGLCGESNFTNET